MRTKAKSPWVCQDLEKGQGRSGCVRRREREIQNSVSIPLKTHKFPQWQWRQIHVPASLSPPTQNGGRTVDASLTLRSPTAYENDLTPTCTKTWYVLSLSLSALHTYESKDTSSSYSCERRTRSKSAGGRGIVGP